MLGFRAWGFGFRVQSGIRVYSLGFMVQGSAQAFDWGLVRQRVCGLGAEGLWVFIEP